MNICFILLCVSCFLNCILFLTLRRNPEIEWIEWMERNRNTGKKYIFCNRFFIWQILRSHVDPIFPVILSKSCNCHILSAVNAPERNEKKYWQRGYKIYIQYMICARSRNNFYWLSLSVYFESFISWSFISSLFDQVNCALKKISPL